PVAVRHERRRGDHLARERPQTARRREVDDSRRRQPRHGERLGGRSRVVGVRTVERRRVRDRHAEREAAGEDSCRREPARPVRVAAAGPLLTRPHRHPPVAAPVRPALLAGAAVAGAVGVAVAAARIPGSGLSPTSVEHGDLGSVLFLVAAFAGFAVYAVGVGLIGRRRAAGSLAAVGALAVVIQLTPLAGPLLLSRDVFAYWDYGDIGARHDGNPYGRTPSWYPHDPAFAAMAPGWRRSPDVYGPAFTLASEGIADASPSRADVAWTFRAAAAAGMLVLVALAAVRARRRALAAAVVGWNPLLALQSAGGGHNDVWMMAFVLAALVLADRSRSVLAGVSWAVAVF